MNTIYTNTYNIYIDDDFSTPFQALLSTKNYSGIFVLVDDNTKEHCLPLLEKLLGNFEKTIITIRPGEENKTLETCDYIWSFFIDNKTDRHALLINLGGGVIGDMGGFSAATYKRGIDFLQMPTTLLAQVDASVGGKLGVNFQGIKNSIGIFHDPIAVFVYPDFIKTLEERELKSGFAEVIKHGLLGADSTWKIITKTDFKNLNFNSIIFDSIQYKNKIVQEDPRESGKRKVLNLGHTIGHALESLSHKTDTPMLHGEAIVIGLVCEGFISYRLLDFKKEDLDILCNLIFNIYKKEDLSKYGTENLLKKMGQDKKNREQKINFTLLRELGQPVWDQEVTVELIEESLVFYKNY